jgi:hypothetical protein
MPTCAAFESGLSAAVAVDRQGPAGTGAYEAGECVFGALTVRGASSISNTLFLVRDRRDAERPKDSPRGAGRSPAGESAASRSLLRRLGVGPKKLAACMSMTCDSASLPLLVAFLK